MSYNWNELEQEFKLILPDRSISSDNSECFKFTRTFLARKQTQGGETWIQAEGDLPICIVMFLQIFKHYLQQ